MSKKTQKTTSSNGLNGVVGVGIQTNVAKNPELANLIANGGKKSAPTIASGLNGVVGLGKQLNVAKNKDLANLIANSGKKSAVGATQPVSMEGIDTANTQGSNVDVNSVETKAGSMADLSNNTEKSQISPMDTTVTKNVGAIDPYTAWINKYNEDVANNNLKGQVDDLTRLSELGIRNFDGNNTGELLARAKQQAGLVPTDILDLQNQNVSNARTLYGDVGIGTAIQNVDNRLINNYERRINEAKQIGDYEKAEQLQAELDQFYVDNSLSSTTSAPLITTSALQTPEEEYEYKLNQLNDKYDNAYKELQTNYQSMYTNVLNDVSNGIIAQLGNLMNFEYDPAKDRALHIAQGYAVGQIKETMNATGMYYSTMTQSAITKAVAELVPVYEKMAKEEIQTNLQMLQNVGSYLMNLEQQQFNMWKTQMEFKIEAIEQKRKDVAMAWERANNLGYIDNQASAILGIEAGTLTYKARKDAQDRQDAIDKELRGYEQQETMARLNDELERGRMQEEYKIDILKMQEQSRLQEERDAKQAAREYTYKRNLLREEYSLANNSNNNGNKKPTYTNGTMSASALEEYYYNLTENSGYTSDAAIKEALNNAKNDSERKSFLASIGEDPKKWLEGTTAETPDVDTANRKKDYPLIGETARGLIQSEDTLKKLQEYYSNGGKVTDLVSLIKGMQAESDEAIDVGTVLDDIIISNQLQGFNKQLAEEANRFGDNFANTSKAFNRAIQMVDDYTSALKELGVDDDIRATYAEYMYEALVDKIYEANNFDIKITDLSNIYENKYKAGNEIKSRLNNPSDEALNSIKDNVYSYINEKLPKYNSKTNTMAGASLENNPNYVYDAQLDQWVPTESVPSTKARPQPVITPTTTTTKAKAAEPEKEYVDSKTQKELETLRNKMLEVGAFKLSKAESERLAKYAYDSKTKKFYLK